MKINLITCLSYYNSYDYINLWALQDHLSKNDICLNIIDLKYFNPLPIFKRILLSRNTINIKNYKSISNNKSLIHEIDNSELLFIAGPNINVITKIKQTVSDLLSSANQSIPNIYSFYFEKDNFTLLLRKNEYAKYETKLLDKLKIKNFVFTHLTNKNSLNLAAHIIKQINIPVITPVRTSGLKCNIIKNKITSPSNYLNSIKNSKYIITDNICCLILLLIYKKPFIYLNNDCNDYGVQLLKRFNLENNIINTISNYKDISSFSIKNSHVLHKKLSTEKEELYCLINEICGIHKEIDETVKCPTNILKSQCCGCYSCKEICPVNAITMVEDKKGFFYPIYDSNKCINCSLCKKSCVILNPKIIKFENKYPLAFAAYNKNLDTRMKSSSGSIFPELCSYIINNNGYVAGACYDNDMNIITKIASTMDDVKKFYGSKYAKSNLNNVYSDIKKLLDEGKYVLFSGLPCECSALRAFLNKEYTSLFICEILCHSVPSAKVFKKYVNHLENKFNSKITNITFRQKKNGWLAHQTAMIIDFKDRKSLSVKNRSNNYFRAFANDIITRQSCVNCKFTHTNRAGDITIGDFWGINKLHPEMFDNNGTSFILINNSQGLALWDNIKDKFKVKVTTLENVFKYNHSKPTIHYIDNDEFFEEMNKNQQNIDNLLSQFNDLKS